MKTNKILSYHYDRIIINTTKQKPKIFTYSYYLNGYRLKGVEETFTIPTMISTLETVEKGGKKVLYTLVPNDTMIVSISDK